MAEKIMTEQEAGKREKTVVPGETILNKIMAQTRIKAEDDSYEVAKTGLETFLGNLIKSDRKTEKIDKDLVDKMVEDLDERLGVQMDEILHHSQLQALESTWRAIGLLVDRVDFKENTKLHLINVSKQDLEDDFEDANDITKSGMYKHLYTDEYGQFGGEPVACVIGDYEFKCGSADIKLMRDISAVSAMAHAPFIAGADPDFFNISTYQEFPGLKDLSAIFEGPQYAKWQGFREDDDSRNFGLTLPRFMSRSQYNAENPVKSFSYNEKTDNAVENYTWSNSSFALGSKIADSFAQFRWCPNILGPQSGGRVNDLPVNHVDANGKTTTHGPTEVKISDRKEYELSELGFIPLVMRKGSDSATFFSANSVQKPKFFGTDAEGLQAELHYRLGTQLPYLFVISRLAHYIKVLQRENLGSWNSSNDLETELNKWIRTYVSNQESPSASIRSRRPLRSADIYVSDIPGESGWFGVELKVTPHIKFMGANFTLSLKGRLDN